MKLTFARKGHNKFQTAKTKNTSKGIYPLENFFLINYLASTESGNNLSILIIKGYLSIFNSPYYSKK